MSHPIYFDTHIIAEIPHSLENMRILDIGCGYGNLARLILSYRYDSFKKNPPAIIGVDIDLKKLTYLRNYSNYQELILADGRCLPFRNKTYNIVLAIELIEHVSKEDGYTIIKELERVTTNKIIVTTPNGFEPCLGHKSAWSYSELGKLGFNVYGIGSKLNHKIKNEKIKFLLYLIHTPLSYIVPFLGACLIATKYLKSS
ncbi:MAG: class I SAM-dependent methyltransferase [Promethearchaeota archaeon]